MSKLKQQLGRQTARFLISLGVTLCLALVCFSVSVYAEPAVNIELNAGEGTNSLELLDLLFLTTLLALLPSFLIMATSFTRIVVVLSFLRNAMGTQQSPPNQVLVGLALFMTVFIMHPVYTEVNEQALKPLTNGVITQQEALERAAVPIKRFMFKQMTDGKELNLFLDISNRDQPLETVTAETTQEELMQLGMEIVLPAFITSELKRAFTIGFILFIPFLVIDMVVSSTLMSMGMVMLPPSMISLPFKIMVFVMVDGWSLLIGTLISGFHL